MEEIELLKYYKNKFSEINEIYEKNRNINLEIAQLTIELYNKSFFSKERKEITNKISELQSQLIEFDIGKEKLSIIEEMKQHFLDLATFFELLSLVDIIGVLEEFIEKEKLSKTKDKTFAS